MGLRSQVKSFQDTEIVGIEKQINAWADNTDNGIEITCISHTVARNPNGGAPIPVTISIYTALVTYLKRKPDEKR